MKLQYSTFIMPHIGDRYSQCADRFAISKEFPCFAIADGVGASFFPEIWAEIISNDFINHCESFENNTVLVREQNLITKWNDLVKEKISDLIDEEKFLIDMSRERCDFAACTFVGLSIDAQKWYCKALGDSYLFVLDKEFHIINSVASQKGHTFDNFPEYFASAHGKNNGTIVSDSGDMSEVAYFVLLTDAISEWFIKVSADKRNKLVSVKNRQSFQSLVEDERNCGEMKDDDTTAVIIKVVHDNSENISVEEIYNTDINQLIKDEEIVMAKQEAERLAKEEEEKARREQTQPGEEDEPNDAPKTPPVEIVTNNEDVQVQTNDKEKSLLGELVQFIQTLQNRLKSFVKEIDSGYKKTKPGRISNTTLLRWKIKLKMSITNSIKCDINYGTTDKNSN